VTYANSYASQTVNKNIFISTVMDLLTASSYFGSSQGTRGFQLGAIVLEPNGASNSDMVVMWLNPAQAPNSNNLTALNILAQSSFFPLPQGYLAVSIRLFCDNQGIVCTQSPTSTPTSFGAAGGGNSVSNAGDGGSSSAGLIAGVIIGVLVLFVIVVLVILFLRNKKVSFKKSNVNQLDSYN
jgi:hypothetical protein